MNSNIYMKNKFNFYLYPEIVEKIDLNRATDKLSRSAWIRQAINEKVKRDARD